MPGIIKAAKFIGQASQAARVAFNLQDMSGRAETFVQGARTKASDVIQQAKDEAEKIRQRAAHEGRQQAAAAAQQAARETAQKQYEALQPALREAIAILSQSKEAWQQHWEQQALRLAIAIAERIVRRQLPQMPDVPLALIRESLELVTGSDQIALHINPRDYELLKDQVDALAAEIGKLASAQIVADADIQLGGCRVDTRFGSIDQQLSAQLERIEQELLAEE